MKKLKKITAALLLLCAIFNSSVISFAAANFDDDGNRDLETGLNDEEQSVIIENSRPVHELDNPEDAYIEELEYDEYIKAKEEYNETVKKLTSLDMWEPLESGTHMDKVKAGEFFVSICKYINFIGFYSEKDSVEVSYQKAYDALKSLGYIDFDMNPEGEINYINAVKILVNAFGYKTMVAIKGNDDSAYISEAALRDIIGDVPSDIYEPMTRITAAHLLEQSTEATVRIWLGDDYRDENVLEYYKDAYKLTGIVEAVSDNSIDSGATIHNGIRIGEHMLTSSRRDLNDYLACKVDAYYHENAGGGETLLYIAYNKDNVITTIEGYNLDSYNGRKIYYFDSKEKKKSISLESDVVEVLNGFSQTELSWEDMENCDYIKAIDNDDDGKYDVVFVYKYDIMLVEKIVPSENAIYGILNGDQNGVINVDFSSEALDMVDRVGNPVEEYYITENSVLSVAKDTNSSRMKIIVSNMMYEGVVKSVSYGENYYETEIAFTDRTYMYSTNYNYFKGNREIKSGGHYTVYLDYRRRIAGYDMDIAEEWKCGYLVRAWLDSETGNEEVGLKLLPYDGEMSNFKMEKKVRIDGYVCDNAKTMMTTLKMAAAHQRKTLANIDESYIRPEDEKETFVYLRFPVMYKLNDKGEIKQLDTPYQGESEISSADGIFYNKTMTLYEDFSKRTSSVKPGGMYLRNTLAFNSDNGNNVAIDTATKVFVVPVSNDTSDINNADLYQKTNLAYFEDWKYYPQTGEQYAVENRLEAYNVNESRVAGVVVYYTSDAAPEIDKKVPLTVVEKIIQSVNEDGETVTCVVGYQGNAQIQVELAEDVILKKYYNGPEGTKIESAVCKGDIIRYVTNSKGQLIDYVKVFSLKDEDDPAYVVVGNEYGKGVEPSTLNKTMIAVSDGKYIENGHDTAHIYNAVGSYNYGATYRLVYGTLLYKNGTNLVLKTKVDTALGKTEEIEIADFSGFNVICIDEESERVYVPREDELLTEYGAGADASKVILHTEGGKQRQLIIVKRAK